MARRDHRLPPILFDLDQTLFDHRHGLRAGLRGLQREFPPLRSSPLADLEADYDHLLDASHRKVLEGRLSLGDSRINRIRRLFADRGEPMSWREARRRTQVYRRAYWAGARAVPGAPQLVRRLRARGHPVGVVTNNPPYGQWEKLRYDGLRDHIQVLVASGALGYAKPDPRIFHVALRRLGLPHSPAVMVGDSYRHDVLGARAAGLAPVWFNPDRRPIPDGVPVRQIVSYRPTSAAVTTLLRAADEL